MKERLVGRAVVIVYVLVTCSLEYGTWGLGGVLISVAGWGQFEVDLVRGFHWSEHRGLFSQLLMTNVRFATSW